MFTVEGCDAERPSVYMGPDGKLICRCMVCGKCGRHTGNSHQGHFWALCSVTKKMETHHFCCPGQCELNS